MRVLKLTAIFISFISWQAYASTFSNHVDHLLSRYQSKFRISGTLAILTPTETYVQGVGLANDLTKTANDEKTIYIIGSTSKQFVATSILKLEDDGLLKTTDAISKYLPDYPRRNLIGQNGIEVTIDNLMQHTSGLPDAYSQPEIERLMYHQAFGIREIISAIRELPLVSDPGAKYEYSNTGYILLGEIIRRIAGTTFGEYLKRSLTGATDFKDTTVGMPTFQTERVARCYELSAQGRNDYLIQNSIQEIHMDDTFTDGNITTTAIDLANWVLKLGTGKILSLQQTRKMFQPSLVSNYADGWEIQRDSSGRLVYTHWGKWLGFESYIAVYPTEQISLVWTGNQELGNEANQFIDDLKNAVYSSSGND